MKPEETPLQLDVSNFGPIAKANIDLRPLTVFVGPSNTGKSYLAVLIYALHKHFSSDFRREKSFVGRALRDPHNKRRDLSEDDINAVREFATLLSVKLKDEKSLSAKSFPLPGPIVEMIRTSLNDQGDYIGNQVRRCFGLETTGSLIRNKIASSAEVNIRQHMGESAHIDHQFTIKADSSDFKTVIPEGFSLRLDSEDDDFEIEFLYGILSNLPTNNEKIEQLECLDNFLTGNEKRKKLEYYNRSRFHTLNFLQQLVVRLYPQIVGSLALPAFYLPADRTGVMHAHSVVVSALIERATMSGIHPAARMPMLSGVLADFLEQLVRFDDPQRRHQNRFMGDHAAQIEKAILGGAVAVERAEVTGYPHFTYQPEGWSHGLPLMNASSMVSELTPVVFYLRHLVSPGSVLIVEEPEAHLHPGLQVEFTRHLARLVQSGVRVVITTHSDWILEELANIVRRSALATTQGETAPDSDIALPPNQVGAWMFKPETSLKGSVVEELILDDETGMYPTDYDIVSENLYNESVNISSLIEARRTE